MSKTRIAVFEGYGASSRTGFQPRTMPRGMGRRGMGAPLYSNPTQGNLGRRSSMGAPLYSNPRPQQLLGYGRRPYRVSPYYEPSSYGPETESGQRSYALKRKGYRVKKGRNSKWQVKFKKAAKKCARIARGRNARKGSYQACMRKSLKKKARRSRR